MDVVEEIDASAREGRRRPLWDKTIDRVERGEADVLVVKNIKRFARSTVEGLRQWKRLDSAGRRLISFEQRIDTSTADGRRRLRDDLSDAEYESDRARRRWSRLRRRPLAPPARHRPIPEDEQGFDPASPR